jgi:hypothetical protein
MWQVMDGGAEKDLPGAISAICHHRKAELMSLFSVSLWP